MTLSGWYHFSFSHANFWARGHHKEAAGTSRKIVSSRDANIFFPWKKKMHIYFHHTASGQGILWHSFHADKVVLHKFALT